MNIVDVDRLREIYAQELKIGDEPMINNSRTEGNSEKIETVLKIL